MGFKSAFKGLISNGGESPPLHVIVACAGTKLRCLKYFDVDLYCVLCIEIWSLKMTDLCDTILLNVLLISHVFSPYFYSPCLKYNVYVQNVVKLPDSNPVGSFYCDSCYRCYFVAISLFRSRLYPVVLKSYYIRH